MKNLLRSISLFAILISCSQIVTAQVYCNPTFAQGCVNWNNSAITLSTLNWTAPSACTTWNFTSTIIPMTAGTPTAMTVTNAAFCGCAVWVDLNNNGNFTDVGELLYSSYNPSSSNVYSFNITLPAATSNGSYRMRVIGPWGSDGVTSTNGTGPCGAYTYGNYQDFTLFLGTICNPPSSINISATTSSSAAVSWSTSANAVGYEYVVNTTPAAPTGAGTATTTTSFNPTSLAANTMHYVHVRSNCSTNFSSWGLDSFMTLINCTPPTNFQVTNVTGTTADISWTGPTGATGYEYVLNNSTMQPSGAGTAIAASSYSASTLTPNTVYYMHVRSSCGTSNLSAWDSVSFKTGFPSGVDNVNDIFLSVSPNPTNDRVTITNNDKSLNGQLQLMSIEGKVLKTFITNSQSSIIDLSTYPAGIYFVKYLSDKKSGIVKVMKE